MRSVGLSNVQCVNGKERLSTDANTSFAPLSSSWGEGGPWVWARYRCRDTSFTRKGEKRNCQQSRLLILHFHSAVCVRHLLLLLHHYRRASPIALLKKATIVMLVGKTLAPSRFPQRYTSFLVLRHSLWRKKSARGFPADGLTEALSHHTSCLGFVHDRNWCTKNFAAISNTSAPQHVH